MIERDGDPWFVAKDVCAEGVLGLGNVTQAVKFLDDDEKKTLPYPAFVQVNGGVT